MTSYPGADTTTQSFNHGTNAGVRFVPNKVVLHSTEGGSWPGYSDGAVAPTLTVKPNVTTQRLEVRQHFPLEVSARALRNLAGGVQTNTARAIQIELVGYCDPSKRGVKGAVFWPEAPEWCLGKLGHMLATLHDLFPTIPLVGAGPHDEGRWPAYPASIKAARMSGDDWSAFRGVCGHMHVPENVHGDPGALHIVRVMKYARGEFDAPPAAVERPEPDSRFDAMRSDLTALGELAAAAVKDNAKRPKRKAGAQAVVAGVGELRKVIADID